MGEKASVLNVTKLTGRGHDLLIRDPDQSLNWDHNQVSSRLRVKENETPSSSSSNAFFTRLIRSFINIVSKVKRTDN